MDYGQRTTSGEVPSTVKREANHDVPGLQVLAGSQGVSIGSLSATNVGRDLNTVQYITNNFGAEPSTANGTEPTQDRRQKILGHLKAPTFRGVYQAALKQRMANTGFWFLELGEFKQFMEFKGVTVWCTGMPGSGKTILASAAIDYVEKAVKATSRTAMAFIFIRYSERHGLRELLASVLRQLIEGNETACTVVWPFYSCSTANEESEFTEPDMAIALHQIAKRLEKVHIFIDGLDEASDQVKDGLLEALAPSGVNLLIFSRPLDLFRGHTPDALFVPIQARTEDIELYVREKVKRNSRLQSILRDRPDKLSELCEKINKSSEGMFLVTKLQMEAIARASSSIASLFRNLQHLPAGVDAMYRHTLARIEDCGDASIAYRVFAWIMGAHPLGVSSACLQKALSFDLEGMDFDSEDLIPMDLILQICQGLVVVDSDSQVRFTHYTTHEYMKSIKLVGVPSPHTLLATTCLAFMVEHRKPLTDHMRESEDRSKGPELHGLDSLEGLEFNGAAGRNYISTHPLLQYAHERWGHHAGMSQFYGCIHPSLHSLLAEEVQYPVSLPPDQSIFGVLADMEIVTGAHLAAMHGIVDVLPTRNGNSRRLAGRSKPGGYTPFHLAAMTGQFDAFRRLLSSYIGVSIRSNDGSSLLHIAVRYRQTSFIQQLVQDWLWECEPVNLGINDQDSAGNTPLMLACERGQEALVCVLASAKGIELDLKNSKGDTVFHCATRCPRVFDLSNITDPYDNQRQDAMSMILCELPQLDPNTEDIKGNTAFMLACESGLLRTVQCLLASGKGKTPFIHQTNNHGQTATMLVCRGGGGSILAGNESSRKLGRMGILKLLLANGSDVHARDADGTTPFLWAVRGNKVPYSTLLKRGYGKEVMTHLLSVDRTVINQHDNYGRTALMLAARSSDLSAIELILSHKAHDSEYINQKDIEGKTAFLYSCHAGRLEIVKVFLHLSCLNVRQRCRCGWSALDWLLSAGYDEDIGGIVQLLTHDARWDASATRKALVRTFSRPPGGGAVKDPDLELGTRLLAVFIPLADAFVWSLEEADTVLLLAIASRARCRIPVVIVLSFLNLMAGRIELGRSGLGLCVDETGGDMRHSGMHQTFRSCLRS